MKGPPRRRAAILWFVAAGLSLAAALLTYANENVVKWPLVAATVAMTAVGFSTLRRSR